MTHPLARYVLGLVLLAVAVPAGADIGSTPIQGWQFPSVANISQTKRAGRVLYVAGTFDAVAPTSGDVGSFALIDPTGVPVRRGARLDGSGSTAVDDGNGGWFVAHMVGKALLGTLEYRLDHVLADGSVDPAFHPVISGGIAALTRLGTTLYAGGFFTSVNGVARGAGAAFDIPTGALLPWNPRVNVGGVQAIAAGGLGRVYIGGSFSTVAGAAVTGLVRVSATTGGIDTVVNTSLSSSGVVNALVTVGNTLYIGGRFDTVENLPRRHLAALDLTTQALTPFVANVADGQVLAMSAQGSRLFVAGSFSELGAGARRSSLAELDATTGAVSAWTPLFGPGKGSTVTGVVAVGDTVYASGTFTRANGQRRAHVAAFDATTTNVALLPWNPGLTDSPVSMIAGPGGEVAVLGTDLTAGARVRDGLAAFDLVTNELLPFAPELDPASVRTLDVTATAVYFGGEFSTVNATTRICLAAVDPDGRLLPWKPGTSSCLPSAILADGATVYVGGQFTTLGGQPRVNLAAVDAVSGTATPLRIDTNGAVYSLQRAGTTLYAGGTFTQPRTSLAAFDTITGTVLPFAPNVGANTLSDIRLGGSLLYLAGTFVTVNGAPRTYAAAVDRVTGVLAPFAPVLDGPVQSVLERNGTVYLAGFFSKLNGAARGGLGAVSAGTGTVTLTFDPSPSTSLVWGGLDSSTNALVGFSSNGRPGLNLWPDAPSSGQPAPPSTPRARVNGATLTVAWDRALVGAAPRSYVLEAATSPGGPALGAVAVGPTASFTVGGVPAGLYYLRVRAVSAGGTSAASPEVGVVIGAAGCTESPSTPVLTAAAGGGSVALQWDTAPGPSASYTLMAGTARGASNLGTVRMGGATSFSGPAPRGVYYLRVQGQSACGVSAPSAEVTLPVDILGPPVSPFLTAQSSGGSVALTWTASPGATSYRVEAGTGPLLRNLGVATLGGTSLTVPGVPAGTYYVRVVAIGPTGESALPDETLIVVP